MNTTEQAASKFKGGMRVRMTEKALQQGLQGTYVNRRTGIVGRNLPNGFPRIKRDGEKYYRTYHPDFWEPADEQAIAPNLCPTCHRPLP